MPEMWNILSWEGPTRIQVLAQGISKSHPVHPWELCPSIPGALAALGMSAFPGEPGQCPTPSGGGIFPEIQPKPPKSALCGSLDEFATFLTKAWNSKGEFAWVEGTRNQKCQKKSQKNNPTPERLWAADRAGPALLPEL